MPSPEKVPDPVDTASSATRGVGGSLHCRTRDVLTCSIAAPPNGFDSAQIRSVKPSTSVEAALDRILGRERTRATFS